MIVLALFTLGNSTDAFLLLKLTDAAGTVRFVPLMWAALHVVKASVSMVAGSWSDRIGRRTVIATGWLVYAVVYAGICREHEHPGAFRLVPVCTVSTSGSPRAPKRRWSPISRRAERRGFAFGIYNAVTGLGALAASLIFGLVWNGVRNDGGVRSRRRARARRDRAVRAAARRYNRSIT